MKGFKKGLSLILTIAMLSASFVSVQAATPVTTNFTSDITAFPTGWSTNTSGTAFDAAENYIRVTTEGKTGNGLVLNQVREVISNSFMQLYRSTDLSIPAGTYTLSYWIKGTGNGPKVQYNVAEGKNHKVSDSLLDGEWHQVTQEFTSTKANTNVKVIMDRPTNCIIDDLSIKDANGTEYVTNGDFETVPGLLEYGDNAYFTGSWWYVYSNQTDIAGKWDRETNYMRLSGTHKKSGNYGLHLKETSGSISSSMVRYQSANTYNIENGSTYRAEVWVKNAPSSSGSVRMYIHSDSKNASNVDVGRIGRRMAATNDVDAVTGFTRYEHKYTTNYACTKKLTIDLQNTADCVIDDFKLYKVNGDGSETLLGEETFENGYPFTYYADGVYDSSWTEGYNRMEAAAPGDVGRFVFVEPSKDVVRGGNGFSMKFHNPNVSYTDENSNLSYMFVENNLSTTLPQGTYTLTYRTYGNTGTVKVGSHDVSGSFITATAGATDEAGWKLHTATINVTSDEWNRLTFMASTGNIFYLDDVSLVDAEGNEYVTDGGFENTVAKDFASEMNLSALPAGSNQATVSWTNPNTRYLENVILYVDGVNYGPQDNAGNVLSAISRTQGVTNNITLTKLANYVPHTVKVVATVDGEEYEATATVTTDEKGSEYTMGDWSVYRGDPILATFNIDRAVKTEGESSLRVDINNKKAVAVSPKVYQDVTYAASMPYSVTFKAKADGITSFKVVESVDGTETVLMEADANGQTHDWMEYKVDIVAKTAETDAQLMFVVETGAGSLWIDDVKVQTVHPILGPSGESLVKNGGFEYNDYTVSAPVFSNVTDTENVKVIEALEAGTIEVKVNIQNYTKDSSFKPALIAALYDGTTLVSTSFIEQTVAESAIDGISSGELAVTVAVPEMTEDTNYSIKVMCWDGMTTMEPLADAVPLN